MSLRVQWLCFCGCMFIVYLQSIHTSLYCLLVNKNHWLRFEFVAQGLIYILYFDSAVPSFQRMWFSLRSVIYFSQFLTRNINSYCTWMRPENVSTSSIKCCNFMWYGDVISADSASPSCLLLKLYRRWNSVDCVEQAATSCCNQTKAGLQYGRNMKFSMLWQSCILII